ncbi:MAG: hypothetical protein QM760_01040 [Nibricoccus sp.]
MDSGGSATTSRSSRSTQPLHLCIVVRMRPKPRSMRPVFSASICSAGHQFQQADVQRPDAAGAVAAPPSAGRRRASKATKPMERRGCSLWPSRRAASCHLLDLGPAPATPPRRTACGRLGQPHRAGAAHDQPRAQLILQLLDLPAQRRLRDVQQLGGTGEVALAGDGDEVAELARVPSEVHARLKYVALQ